MSSKVAASFVIGFIFAVGLALAGMTLPGKVIGFLDVFGQWDPSLMFVMIGAIGVHAIAYRLIRRRSTPLLDTKFFDPEKTGVTGRLIFGAAIFGIGWGLGGYCPGPAITSLGARLMEPAIFVVAMIAGMILAQLFMTAVSKRKPI